ncbi:inactive N-acetylated-alpha-linked acidic dipeptidase-like protein 2 [Rhinatrema bivittatum]|uniref:inactive N-acetylated-alpha-linked acidic dipeptidase-like protein 2 n=1 Tax=Rhinatrema bivittatum TaxID=194408 RepID=UPI001126B621|nr:inactive N-acetylated-alpha-linked acidic dipeptidase-like protein 2 [Rhinatrema bivittatum]
MGEKEANLPAISLQGTKMAYQKMNVDHKIAAHTEYLDNNELQSTTLDLEWDMETELEDPGFDHFSTDGTGHQHLGNSPNTDLDFTSFETSMSPKGRFQRLQEDPDYLLHCSRPAPKTTNFSFCQICKIFCSVASLFIFGLLIGYYSRTDCHPHLALNQTDAGFPFAPHETDRDQDILQEIHDHEIKRIFRNLTQLYNTKTDTDLAKELMVEWSQLGLKEVQMLNYSVLLEQPDSSPNTITEQKSGQCFYPNGQQCDKETKEQPSQELLFSYAAYSAKGFLEAEVIDVKYGTVDDLKRVQTITNVTNKIALMKLGFLPLLYKVSLLEEMGFGGVLLYVDPCDLPKISEAANKSFLVTLNSGGDPATPGYSSIDGSYRQNQSNLTSLLVQPISVSLVKTLFSLPETDSRHECLPLEVTSAVKIQLKVQTVPVYKTISNIVGYLKGSTFPDRYVIVGSHHNSLDSHGGQEWASGTAILTVFLQALLLKAKKGWRPDRTIVFCSWGGTAFGNIGSYEWAEDLKRVLQRNTVAYVSLHNPVRGNLVLNSIASPSLQQLVAETLDFSCMKTVKCQRTNVSSVQMQGDADYFINHLGVPTVQFIYEDNKESEIPSFLSEAVFPADTTEIESLDPSFILHTIIAKLGELDDLIPHILQEMDIDPPPDPVTQDPTVKKGDPLLAGLRPMAKAFPTHYNILQLISREWDTPESNLRVGRAMDKLYPLPTDFLELLRVPAVDSAVSAVTKHTTIPVTGGTALKDTQDRKLEAYLKRIFEVSALGMRAAICSSLAQRAGLRWIQQLLTSQSLPDGEAQLADRLEAVVAYGADAFYDLIRVQARAMVAAVSARRLLWLRNWAADASSKTRLGSLPFKGRFLFGEDLDQIIKSLNENAVHKLPEDQPRSYRSFNTGRNRFRSQRKSRPMKQQPP